jgi:quercetin dioxygenase-like cupin family protein
VTLKPTVRRVLTGHDADARAVISTDTEMNFRDAVGGDAKFAVIWSTDSFPSDNQADVDGGRNDIPIARKGGSVLRIVDMKPGVRSPFHRTVSLDYGIVLEGEVVLELDDGEETVIRKGDVVVQRGTIHAWINRSEDWARMAFVLLDARPVEIGGKVIGEEDADH